MHNALLWGAGATAKAPQPRVFCAATTADCYVSFDMAILEFSVLAL